MRQSQKLQQEIVSGLAADFEARFGTPLGPSPPEDWPTKQEIFEDIVGQPGGLVRYEPS